MCAPRRMSSSVGSRESRDVRAVRARAVVCRDHSHPRARPTDVPLHRLADPSQQAGNLSRADLGTRRRFPVAFERPVHRKKKPRSVILKPKLERHFRFSPFIFFSESPRVRGWGAIEAGSPDAVFHRRSIIRNRLSAGGSGDLGTGARLWMFTRGGAWRASRRVACFAGWPG